MHHHQTKRFIRNQSSSVGKIVANVKCFLKQKCTLNVTESVCKSFGTKLKLFSKELYPNKFVEWNFYSITTWKVPPQILCDIVYLFIYVLVGYLEKLWNECLENEYLFQVTWQSFYLYSALTKSFYLSTKQHWFLDV